MLHQTRGIVLKSTRFRESSAIVNIYTERLGLQTYIVNSIFSKKAKNKAAYLQPLSLLDLVVYYREKQNIKRIKELRWALIFQQIPFHHLKRSIAVFINEVLTKTIKEEESNSAKFNFLFNKISFLDETKDNLANYLICFLLEFSQYLGFAPLNNRTESKPYFSINQGMFVENHILNKHQLNEVDSNLMYYFLSLDNNLRLATKLKKSDRKELLLILIRYYQMHIENFGQLKSLNVLVQILNV